MTRRLLILPILLALVAVACSGGDSNPVAPTPTIANSGLTGTWSGTITPRDATGQAYSPGHAVRVTITMRDLALGTAEGTWTDSDGNSGQVSASTAAAPDIIIGCITPTTVFYNIVGQ